MSNITVKSLRDYIKVYCLNSVPISKIPEILLEDFVQFFEKSIEDWEKEKATMVYRKDYEPSES